ncbi:MAG: hypothetical protein K2M17_05290 [Bacilli bacterium]|nr:hypothetical protein [Bacilli bacterium]
MRVGTDNLTLDQIKAIQLWYGDSATEAKYVHFYKEDIRKFSCEFVKDNFRLAYHHFVSSLYLEVDLDYVKNAYAAVFRDKLGPWIYDFIQLRNVRGIRITLFDGSVLALNVPNYRKELYFNKNRNEHRNAWEDTNMCEHHEEKESTYVIHWYYDKNDTFIADDEMKTFFQNELLAMSDTHTWVTCSLSWVGAMFSLEEKKKYLSRVVVYDEKKDAILGWQHNGYNFDFSYKFEGDLDIYHLLFKSGSYAWLLKFVLVPFWDEKMEEVIMDMISKEKKDSSHYFSRIVLVASDSIDQEKLKQLKEANEKLLYLTYADLNECWWQTQSGMLSLSNLFD